MYTDLMWSKNWTLFQATVNPNIGFSRYTMTITLKYESINKYRSSYSKEPDFPAKPLQGEYRHTLQGPHYLVKLIDTQEFENGK